MRLFNDTGERIVMEPGEYVDVYGDSSKNRVLASRTKVLEIQGHSHAGMGQSRMHKRKVALYLMENGSTHVDKLVSEVGGMTPAEVSSCLERSNWFNVTEEKEVELSEDAIDDLK